MTDPSTREATAGDPLALVVVANRGPLSLVADPRGAVTPGPTPGGLVTALAPTLGARGALWLCAPMTDADRQAARARRAFTQAALRARFVDLDPEAYRQYYEVVSNGVLWPLFHGLGDLVRQTMREVDWAPAWHAYRDVNIEFAKAVATYAPPATAVFVQDYHLVLLGHYLRLLRPDLRAVHFSHTPFCTPGELGLLPASERLDLLEGLAAYRACGFHATAWAAAYRACSDELGMTPAPTFVQPLGVHHGDLATLGGSAACADAGRQIDSMVGDKRLVVRVDRLDPTKNLLGGFHAFSRLLEDHPRLRGHVTFLAHAVPSREGLASMRAYRHQVEQLVQRINARWARPGWTPVILEISTDRTRALAALSRFDVLLVSSFRDGMNLVALEGALSNRRDGVLVLSRRAGAWEQLGDAALGVDPFDEENMAGALGRALDLGRSDRATMADAAREAATALHPRR